MMHFIIWIILALLLFFIVFETSVNVWLNSGIQMGSKAIDQTKRGKVNKKSVS